MRILITGSRDWTDHAVIEEVLSYQDDFYGRMVLVSGACPTGADMLCERYATLMGWTVERHPADWEKYGKKAGFTRNADMVNLGADLCAAFIKNNSLGATMCANLALQAHIPLLLYTDENKVTLK